MKENSDFIEFCIILYKEKYTIPNNLKYEIEVTEDLEESVKGFFLNTNRRIENIDIDNSYNGTTCVPRTINEPTYIFISKKLIENFQINNFQFVCTIFHELTHAIDFYNFCVKYCNGIYNDFDKIKEFYGFKMWTEFNAKKISYLLYCQFINGDRYNSNEALDMILDSETKFQNNYIADVFFNTDNVERVIYELILYLGRYYVWDITFKGYFEEGKMFSNAFDNFKTEIFNLYNILKIDENNLNYYYEIHKLINILKGKIIINKS